MGGGNMQHLDKVIISLLNQKPQALSQHQPERRQHQQTTKVSGVLMELSFHSDEFNMWHPL